MHDDNNTPPNPVPEGVVTGRYRVAEGQAGANGGRGRDAVLDRSVSIRSVGHAGADDLEREARFLARFNHSGLPLVLDFVRGDAGAILVSRDMPGVTLDAAMIRMLSGTVVPGILTPAACAVTFVQVCEALAAAHDHGVVHRHLAPSCITLGHHGQCTVGGWDTQEGCGRPLTLRFVSASPVTPELSPDGVREDIQGVGACLFCAVVREAPPIDAARQLGPVGRDVEALVPSALLAIIKRAMSTDAAGGFATIRDLRLDLLRFLDGQAPQALGQGYLLRSVRWIDERRRPLLLLTASIAILLSAVLIWRWNDVRTFAAWGPTVMSEGFDRADWNARWDTGSMGSWHLVNGRMVSSGDYDSYLILRKRLATPVAIEYTAQMLPNSKPGDLSLWWCEGEPFDPSGSVKPWSLPGYFIQAGAYENSYSGLYRAPAGTRCAHANLKLAPGVDHHIRVEIEDGRIRQWINGTLTLDYTDIFPSPSGYLALYGYSPGKSFDDVRIWQRDIPTLVSPLAIGDTIYQQGRYREAAAAFASVAGAHAGSNLGEQARFRQSIALAKAGDQRGSRVMRDLILDQALRHRAQCLDVDDLIDKGDWTAAVTLFDEYWRTRDDARAELRLRWQAGSGRLLALPFRPQAAAIDAWFAMRQRLFPADEDTAGIAADLLLRRNRHAEVLAMFPNQHRSYSWALLALGRAEEVLAADWSVSHERILAYAATGRLAEALASPSMHPDMRASMLCWMGRFEDSLAISPWPASLYTGQLETLLAIPLRANAALIVAGRLEEAAGPGVPGIPGSGKDALAMILLGRFDEAEAGGAEVGYYRMFAHLAAGRDAEAWALRREVTGNTNGQNVSQWFGAHIALALADEANGSAGALRKALLHGRESASAWGGQLAAVARAALDPADDSSIANMPWKVEVKAWSCVVEALRAELRGDSQGARKGWTAFRSLPITDRLLVDGQPDAELEWCCTWRLAALQRTP